MIWILCYLATISFVLYLTAHVAWKAWTGYLSSFQFAKNVPWLGVLPYLDLHPHRLFKQMVRYINEYDHLYVSWMGPRPKVVFGRTEYIKTLLTSHKSLDKNKAYDMFNDWLGTGLLTSTGEKWKRRRAAITPAFHFNILQDYVGIYDENALNLVKHLRSHADTSNAIDIQKLISLATLDVICQTSMGVRVNALGSSDSEYVRTVEEVKDLIIKRMLNPFVHNKTIYKFTSDGKRFYKHVTTLQNFTVAMINKRIKERNNSKADGSDNTERGAGKTKNKRVFIDILLDLYDKNEIDIDGIREEVDTIIAAGHDTTASSLCWTLYHIGRHPEIQDRLYDEVKTVSARECSLNEKIREMKYTECVIKESLRLNPPALEFGRALKEEMRCKEHVIPNGTQVICSTLGVHTNAAYWDNPYEFNPGRFEGEDILKRDPFSFIPFSAGPRNCIGQKFAMLEEKVFLYRIISQFRIESTQPPDEIQPTFSTVSTSFNGIYLKLYSRE